MVKKKKTKNFFSVLISDSYTSHCKNFTFFTHFYWVDYLCIIELQEYYIYSGYTYYVRCVCVWQQINYFFWSIYLAFSFSQQYLWAELLNLDETQFSTFCLLLSFPLLKKYLLYGCEMFESSFFLESFQFQLSSLGLIHLDLMTV